MADPLMANRSRIPSEGSKRSGRGLFDSPAAARPRVARYNMKIGKGATSGARGADPRGSRPAGKVAANGSPGGFVTAPES